MSTFAGQEGECELMPDQSTDCARNTECLLIEPPQGRSAVVKAAKHKPLTSGKRRFIVADPVSIIGALEAPLLAINRIPTFSKAHFASKVADLGPPLGRQQ